MTDSDYERRFCSECGARSSLGKFCSHCGTPYYAITDTSHPDAEPENLGPDWGGRIERATSFRVGCFSLLIGVVGATILSYLFLPESAVGWVGLIIAAVVWFAIVGNDGQAMKCPRCRKRVKLGADTCHHCGAYTA